MADAESTRLKSLWDRTCAKWLNSGDEKTKPEKQRLMDRIGKVHNKEELEDLVKSETKELDRYRTSHPKFWKYLNVVATSLESSSGLISFGLSFTSFSAASAILSPVVHLVKSAASISEIYDWIEDLLESLQNFTVLLCEYIKAELPRSLNDSLVDMLGCFFDIIVQCEKAVTTSKWRHFAARAFLSKDETVLEAFDKLAKLGKRNSDLVLAIMFVTQTELADEMKKLHQKYDDEKNTKFLEQQLFSKGAYDANSRVSAQIKADVLEGTGQWLLETEEFRQWVDGKRNFLWVSGSPGTGKSCLSSVVQSYLTPTPSSAEDTAERRPITTHISWAAFNIRKDSQDLHDPRSILTTLVYLLTESDPVYRFRVINALRKDRGIMASVKTIWETLLVDPFLSYTRMGVEAFSRRAILILDGVDEAPRESQKELFGCLETLACAVDESSRVGGLSILFFGRHELRDWLLDCKALKNALSIIDIGDQNKKDIETFLKKEVNSMEWVKSTNRSRKMDGSSGQEKFLKTFHRRKRTIFESVRDGSTNIFLKAALTMRKLRGQGSWSRIKSIVDNIPLSLDDMIAAIFEEIMSDETIDKAVFNTVLGWVSLAGAPLSLGQLYEAVKTQTGICDLRLERQLVGRFASLFQVTNTWGECVTDLGPMVPNPRIHRGNGDGNEDDESASGLRNSDGDDDDKSVWSLGSASSDSSANDADDQFGIGVVIKSGKDREDYPFTPSTWLYLDELMVSFAHTSILEFVQSYVFKPVSSGTGAHGDGDGIEERLRRSGINTNTAMQELEMISACIRSILERPRGHGTLLGRYGCQFLVHHLSSEHLQQEDLRYRVSIRCRMVALITRFFHSTDKLVKAYTITTNTWASRFLLQLQFVHFTELAFQDILGTRSWVSKLQTWLRDSDASWFDSEEERVWATEAVSSRHSFLRPLVMAELVLSHSWGVDVPGLIANPAKLHLYFATGIVRESETPMEFHSANESRFRFAG